MKAIVLERFGGTENFALADLPRPEPKGDEVRIRVKAASFNPVDFKVRQGRFGGDLPVVLGHDLSGVVDACGPEVTDFAVGDDVWAYLGGPRSNGAYAEWVCVPSAFVGRRPALSWEEAAAVPLVGLTAYEVVVKHGKPRRGETTLLTGASGGVGTMAIGILRTAPAGPIVATAGSDASAAYIASLGVERSRIVRYENRSVEELEAAVRAANGGHPVDVAIDLVGGAMKRLACASVGFGGRVVTAVEEPEGADFPVFEGRSSPLFRRSAVLHFEFLGARALFGGPEDWQVYREELTSLAQLLDTSRIRAPAVEVADFSVETVRRAHEALEGGHVQGKLVMRVSP